MSFTDANLKYRLDYQLKMLESSKAQYAARLERLGDCKEAFLRRTKRKNGKHYYYVKRHKGSKYRYLGDADHREVKRVREARFLKEAIRRIDHDIALIKALTNGFLSYDASSVSEGLPSLYRCEVPPVSEAYQRESARWMNRRLEFQSQHPENYPERKTHRTSDGIWVKSISEVTMYEMFKNAGFAQIYELPLVPVDHGPALYPDFTILSPVDMKTEIIVEFFGRMDKFEYREDFARRIGKYMAKGFIPGVTLFFVFNGPDGEIDTAQINDVIEKIRGTRSFYAA